MRTSSFVIITSVMIFALGTFGIQDAFAVNWNINDPVANECSSIGTWDDPTKTCTLTGDLGVDDTIGIRSPGVTLDGNGYTMTGSGTVAFFAITYSNADNTIIKNFIITGYDNGIGGTSDDNITIMDNTITGPSVYSGIRIGIDVTNSDGTIISGNTIQNFALGIELEGFSFGTVEKNIIVSNAAGISIKPVYDLPTLSFQDSDQTTIQNNIVAHTFGGGGIDSTNIDPTSQIFIRNNHILDIFSAGIALNSGIVVIENNIIGDAYQGIFERTSGVASAELYNNVFYNPGPNGHYYIQSTTTALTTEIELNSLPNSANNLVGDPNLVNPNPGGDYHLQAGSIAIDAGLATNAPSEDFEGDARPQGAGFDIGADEFISGSSGGASSTQGQVDIIAADTCGINIVSGDPIDYGSLTPGQESSIQPLVLDNTGNVFATLFVQGGDWLDVMDNPQMSVSDTHYDLSDVNSYAMMTPLSTMDSIVSNGMFDPNNDLPMFWQLVANIQGAFQGSLTQTVDFTVSCN